MRQSPPPEHGPVQPSASRLPLALIIGGGFSGTMIAVQLARRGIASTIIDPSERPARGLAYSTTLLDHRLNVRASNMSAFPDAPDHFAAFLASRGGTPDSFASRSDYGDYLASNLEAAVATGLVTLVQGRAVHAEPEGEGWKIHLADGRQLVARSLVLATGNAAPGPLAALSSVPGDDLLDQLWSPRASARLERATATDEPVLIVGTGLTMVDAVLSLDAAGHRGPVTAVSRRGLLPLAHAATTPSTLPPPELSELPVRASELARWIRRRAGEEGEWRRAIDGLRPLTQGLWQRMSGEDKRRFLRHGRAWWDIHRHRIAPEVHERVGRLIAEKRLRVIAGRLVGARPGEAGHLIEIAPRGAAQTIEVEAGMVINCTGPRPGLRGHPDRLISQMREDGLLKPDPLDLGADIDEADRLAGITNAYAVGPIAKGRYWEIIAVPDLRGKAAEIADAIAEAELASGYDARTTAA